MLQLEAEALIGHLQLVRRRYEEGPRSPFSHEEVAKGFGEQGDGQITVHWVVTDDGFQIAKYLHDFGRLDRKQFRNSRDRKRGNERHDGRDDVGEMRGYSLGTKHDRRPQTPQDISLPSQRQ